MAYVRKLCGIYTKESAEHQQHGKRVTTVIGDALIHQHGTTDTGRITIVEEGEDPATLTRPHARFAELDAIDEAGDWVAQMMTEEECAQWAADTAGALDS